MFVNLSYSDGAAMHSDVNIPPERSSLPASKLNYAAQKHVPPSMPKKWQLLRIYSSAKKSVQGGGPGSLEICDSAMEGNAQRQYGIISAWIPNM
jgi:hypothetical protein